jgi:DNA polymerase-3 subunit beta
MTNSNMLTIPANVLKAALVCASTDAHRYYLHGVYVDPRGYLVSTDGHRMFVGKIDVSGGIGFEGWIIPAAAVKRALTGHKSATIDISPTRCGDVSCEPVDGTSPDWTRVVAPADVSNVPAQFNPAYIGDMGKIAAALSGTKSAPVHIHYNGEGPTPITFPSYDGGAFAILMPIRQAHNLMDWEATRAAVMDA